MEKVFIVTIPFAFYLEIFYPHRRLRQAGFNGGFVING